MAARSISVFKTLKPAPADPILSLTTSFLNDPAPHSHKINLGVGAYRTDAGKPWVLPSVQEAERRIIEDSSLNHEYIPILGTPKFVQLVQGFLFDNSAHGNTSKLLSQGRIVTGQGISGTGSLRVLGEFVLNGTSTKKISIPNPSWANHEAIFHNAGLEVVKYSYYDRETQGLHLGKLLEDLRALSPGDAVLLHVCCHNPTGIDPTAEEWEQILAIVEERQLLPLFDMAYQGFSTGLVEDLSVLDKVSQMVDNGKIGNMLLAQSFAKNMGLYGERVGSFSVVTASDSESRTVASQLKRTVRAMYSSPPCYGSKIVEKILEDDALRSQWSEEVSIMRDRLKNMRQLLYDRLVALGCHGPGKDTTGWGHLISQQGMFCFTGLTAEQVGRLQQASVYMTANGRMSVAGITPANVGRLAEEIASVM